MEHLRRNSDRPRPYGKSVTEIMDAIRIEEAKQDILFLRAEELLDNFWSRPCPTNTNAVRVTRPATPSAIAVVSQPIKPSPEPSFWSWSLLL